MTPAGSYHHIIVGFQDYIGGVVEIEELQGSQSGRGAFGLRGSLRIHQIDQSLHYGVVRRIHSCLQRKGTFPLAIIGRETFRSDYPVLKISQFLINCELSHITHFNAAQTEIRVYPNDE